MESSEEHFRLRRLCEVIRSEVRSCNTFSPKERKSACLNRSRAILLTETLKISEKYNSIGSQYSSQVLSEISPLRSLIATSSSLPENVNPFIVISPLSNPHPSSFFSVSVSTDDLRRVISAARNEVVLNASRTTPSEAIVATDMCIKVETKVSNDIFERIIAEYVVMDLSPCTMLNEESKALHIFAVAATPVFEKIMDGINSHIDSLWDASVEVDVHIGPPKLPSRVIEKAKSDYDDNPRRVVDIVRSSVYCNSMRAMEGVVSFLQSEYVRNALGVVVLRVKNGFEPVISVDTYGYRDIKVNVWIPCDVSILGMVTCTNEHNAGIIGEIQLHLKEMYHVKNHMGHRMYSWIRKNPISGIIRSDVLLRFGVNVAECTVSQCCDKIIQLLDYKSKFHMECSSGFWLHFADLSSGRSYYVNQVTGSSQWEMPQQLRVAQMPVLSPHTMINSAAIADYNSHDNCDGFFLEMKVFMSQCMNAYNSYDTDIEELLSEEEKYDINLSQEVCRENNLLVTKKEGSFINEVIGREVEILMSFVEYRSDLTLVKLDDYHTHLRYHADLRVKSLAELVAGQIPAITIPLEHLSKDMPTLIAYLTSVLGETPALLQMLQYVNKEYCGGSSYYLIQKSRNVCLRIYKNDRSHPIYLALLVEQAHLHEEGVIKNVVTAFMDDYFFDPSSSEYLGKLLQAARTNGSKIKLSVDEKSENFMYRNSNCCKNQTCTFWSFHLKAIVFVPLSSVALLFSSSFYDHVTAAVRLTLQVQSLGHAHPLGKLGPTLNYIFYVVPLSLQLVTVITYCTTKNSLESEEFGTLFSITFIVIAICLLLGLSTFVPRRRLHPYCLCILYNTCRVVVVVVALSTLGIGILILRLHISILYGIRAWILIVIPFVGLSSFAMYGMKGYSQKYADVLPQSNVYSHSQSHISHNQSPSHLGLVINNNYYNSNESHQPSYTVPLLSGTTSTHDGTLNGCVSSYA